jgi:ribosome maturation factor RimP
LPDELTESIGALLTALGFSLIEHSVSRHKGAVDVRLCVDRRGGVQAMGVAECAELHRAVLPRLELLYAPAGLSMEVSSPGIERNIKDASEFEFFIGRRVRCYRTDITDWTSGVLLAADESHLELETRSAGADSGGVVSLDYKIIAKAKLEG